METLIVKIFLMITVVFIVPSSSGPATHSHPVSYQFEIDTIHECYSMAEEMSERAKNGELLKKSGGFFTASCQVQIQPSEEH